MAFMVNYKGQLSERGPSQSIWADCPVLDIAHNPGKGMYLFDDFTFFPNPATNTAYGLSGWRSFVSDGALIADASEQGGAITISSDGDNEGASLQAQASYLISGIAGSKTGKLWFEARLKTDTIADSKNGFFVGLCGASALSATVPIAANGTLADSNFVGFHRLEADGDKLDTVYKANGVAQVNVQTDAVTLVANTYVKVGFKFDPVLNTIVFYQNGTALSTSKGASVLGATAGTDFPNDVALGPIIGFLNATASSPGSATFDWIRVAQEF
jgi:hypothetical protein